MENGMKIKDDFGHGIQNYEVMDKKWDEEEMIWIFQLIGEDGHEIWIPGDDEEMED